MLRCESKVRSQAREHCSVGAHNRSIVGKHVANAVKPDGSECRIYFRHIEWSYSFQRYPWRNCFIASREFFSCALHPGRWMILITTILPRMRRLSGYLNRIIDLKLCILLEVGLSCFSTLFSLVWQPPAGCASQGQNGIDFNQYARGRQPRPVSGSATRLLANRNPGTMGRCVHSARKVPGCPRTRTCA
ncbi:hypothetical protein SAMN04488135_107123 [Pollutimonas bauzanensis]|uniref:Uncharacterized protein n=1 Tax=Pollutimonas bauzanensis TaxID=658167 RepID=A0A1M5XSW8_9BURK|nr:hypothetical protein SAMN04488135_107123 [Pollutimonas bauzanensis]